MNQTQVLDEAIRNQHQDAYLTRQNIEIESGIYNFPMNWTSEIRLSEMGRVLEAEESDFERARLIRGLMLNLIWSQIGDYDADDYELRRWAEASRDDDVLMMLIIEAETIELFLTPRLHEFLDRTEYRRVSSDLLRLILEAEETNLSSTQQHQIQPLFRRLRAVLMRLRTFF